MPHSNNDRFSSDKRSESTYSTIYQEDSSDGQSRQSDASPWSTRNSHASTTSTGIIDTYRRRPDYQSIAMSNPFNNNAQPMYDLTKRPVHGFPTPIPPLPELVSSSPAPQPQNQQYSAVNHGLRQYFNPYSLESPFAQQTVPRPGTSDVSRLHATDRMLALAGCYRIPTRPLNTVTPADKTWEGSWLRKGTLRFDTKAQKKLDRKALKEAKKAEQELLGEERKESKRFARMVKKWGIED